MSVHRQAESRQARITKPPGLKGLTLEQISPQSRLALIYPPAHEFIERFQHAIVAWVVSHPHDGAFLLRGFSVSAVSAFKTFVHGFGHEPLDYEYASTPRSRIQPGVYTSTEYPPHQSIPLHNEQSYTRNWPLKIWFYCVKASPVGGETPIADSREVYQRIDPAIRQRFIEKRLMYVRNYGGGLDVPWQRVFNTAGRHVVERYCDQQGIEFEWKPDDELRTRQVCQAAARHPITGEQVWFNQAHLFHIASLEPQVREALLGAVDEPDLPRNVYYGDGDSIETAVLDDIRAAYQATQVTFSWQPGDILMLDNMLFAHGRRPYQGERKVLVAMAEPHHAEKSIIGASH